MKRGATRNVSSRCPLRNGEIYDHCTPLIAARTSDCHAPSVCDLEFIVYAVDRDSVALSNYKNIFLALQVFNHACPEGALFAISYVYCSLWQSSAQWRFCYLFMRRMKCHRKLVSTFFLVTTHNQSFYHGPVPPVVHHAVFTHGHQSDVLP